MATTAGLSRWMKWALSQLFAELRQRGYSVQLYSGRRSYAAQLQRYLAGHTTVPPWQGSKHQDGKAADLIITPRSGYAVAGRIWTELGGLWGGNFKDRRLAQVEFQHFEESSSSSSRSVAVSRRSGLSSRSRRSSSSSMRGKAIGYRLRRMQRRAGR